MTKEGTINYENRVCNFEFCFTPTNLYAWPADHMKDMVTYVLLFIFINVVN